MTEHAYIRSIHSRLRKDAPSVYARKINDPYQGGVADAYYSDSRDMWIEYKYLKALPKRATTRIEPGLSELQKDWLRERHAQGRNVAVIIGSPDGSMILPGITWDATINQADFISSAVDKSQVVAYIKSQVCP